MHRLISYGVRTGFLISLSLVAWSARASGPITHTAYQSPSPIAVTPIAPESAGTPVGADVYILSAPPRGTLAQESKLYDPIANYLSQVTGKRVIYRYSQNWLVYSRDMTRGKYDFVFDGPHFNGWREANIGHVPLVKLPEPFVFVVIKKSGNTSLKTLADLAGQPVCANAPPNLGTLILDHQFADPFQKPYLVDVHGWAQAYHGLLAGRCQATVLPLKNLEKFEHGKDIATVLFQSPALPNQAFSAGPRVNQHMRAEVRTALLSTAGEKVTAPLRAAYAAGNFVPATRAEYAGLGKYLSRSLYYQ